MTDLDKKRVDAIIRFALKEDVWTGDITSQSVLAEGFIADAEEAGYGSQVRPVAPDGLGTVSPQSTVPYESLNQLIVAFKGAQRPSPTHSQPLGVDLTKPYDCRFSSWRETALIASCSWGFTPRRDSSSSFP